MTLIPTFWTPARRADLLQQIGKKPLARVAASYGTTTGAIDQYLKDYCQTSVLREVNRLGMTDADVATALGVVRRTVQRWMQSGRLHTISAWMYTRKIRLVRVPDLIDFLKTTGAMIDRRDAMPSAGWYGIVQQIESDWHTRYVTAYALSGMLHITPAQFTAQQLQRNGFPRPHKLGGGRPDYFDRAAVRAWLNEHPHYWTTQAREGL